MSPINNRHRDTGSLFLRHLRPSERVNSVRRVTVCVLSFRSSGLHVKHHHGRKPLHQFIAYALSRWSPIFFNCVILHASILQIIIHTNFSPTTALSVEPTGFSFLETIDLHRYFRNFTFRKSSEALARERGYIASVDQYSETPF